MTQKMLALNWVKVCKSSTMSDAVGEQNESKEKVWSLNKINTISKHINILMKIFWWDKIKMRIGACEEYERAQGLNILGIGRFLRREQAEKFSSSY